MTKAILVALMLNEEGKLSLDDPLSKYFPSLKAMKVLDKDELVEAISEPTVADLLRHTSGLTYALHRARESVRHLKMPEFFTAIKKWFRW